MQGYEVKLAALQFRASSLMTLPSLPLERWLDHLRQFPPCAVLCPPKQAFMITYMCLHRYACLTRRGSYSFRSGSALCAEFWHLVSISRDFTEEMFFIPPTPFMGRQDWIVFANPSCFANFPVYMGIYDSLSPKRNSIGVCLNLLRFSDWFCSHRTSF